MNSKKFAFLICVILLLLIGSRFYKIYNLVLDFRALFNLRNSSLDWKLKPIPKPNDPQERYLPTFAQGLDSPEKLLNSASDFVPLPWGKSNSKNSKTPEELKTFLEGVPNFTRFEDTLISRCKEALASLPSPLPNGEHVRFSAPTPNFKKIRETARLWAAIAIYQSHENQSEKAYWTLLAIPILAHHLEVGDTKVHGLCLITKMIGCTLRNISGGVMVTIAPQLRITKDSLLKGFDLLGKLEKLVAPLSQAIDYESKFLPSLSYYLERDIKSGDAKKALGRNPYAILNALSDTCRLKTYLDPIYETSKRAMEKPFPESREEMRSLLLHTEKLYKRITEPDFHWLGYFFEPETYLIEFLLSIHTANIRKAYETEISSWQKLRGALCCVAFYLYSHESKKSPRDLKELENWLGRSLPDDLFSNSPIRFSSGESPKIFSVGPDGSPRSSDDIQFILTSGETKK